MCLPITSRGVPESVRIDVVTADRAVARPDIAVGLCRSCRFVEIITSSKASTFYRCRLSETDPSFRRYPLLPVVSCRGYRRVEAES